MTKKVALKRVVLPRKRLERLDIEEQYSLHLLGHIFNETMALARLVQVTQTDRLQHTTDAQAAGAAFNTMFFCRLLAGKVYEGRNKVNTRAVQAFLKKCCFPFIEGQSGPTELKALNRAASTCRWLEMARNGHAMHYPSLEQCRPALELLASQNAGFEYIIGPVNSQSLYHSSDAMAGLALFLEVDPNDWRSGVATMAQELSDVATRLTDFIQTAVVAYIEEARIAAPKDSYTTKVKIRDVAGFEAPLYDDYFFPYFFYCEPKSE